MINFWRRKVFFSEFTAGDLHSITEIILNSFILLKTIFFVERYLIMLVALRMPRSGLDYTSFELAAAR